MTNSLIKQAILIHFPFKNIGSKNRELLNVQIGTNESAKSSLSLYRKIFKLNHGISRNNLSPQK
jgi:hypothetical protein